MKSRYAKSQKRNVNKSQEEMIAKAPDSHREEPELNPDEIPPWFSGPPSRFIAQVVHVLLFCAFVQLSFEAATLIPEEMGRVPIFSVLFFCANMLGYGYRFYDLRRKPKPSSAALGGRIFWFVTACYTAVLFKYGAYMYEHGWLDRVLTFIGLENYTKSG
eukprot:CAMPEP_0183815190 /NCGR_PEP_ID=MMETSP0803_2-20130417/56434_1 /TAXON_ID=195967 /ORGANISM="Crustomastix stigmata, Strain CCMP3273" /LENGTH=159 /DNA_ID=CAMNT_0026060055 /DNA_START=143 /DNA_END=618 /DNA_ORIENTATION=+